METEKTLPEGNPAGRSPGETPDPVWILHVEKDQDAVAFVKSNLDGRGYSFETAATGEQCLARFQCGPPRVCLLDLELPDLAGLDLLRTLHRKYPDVPVIVLSGSTAVHDVVAAMRLGSADYLSKPIDIARLAISIENALQLSWKKKDIARLTVEAREGHSKVLIDEILGNLVLRGGSDLHLKGGRPPLMRISGTLVDSPYPALDPEDIKGILRQVLGPEGYGKLEADFEFDGPYAVSDIARFRVNAFKRMGQYGAAFRVIPLAIPTIDQMGLPPALRQICQARQGLVLVTGTTGSGKSTTLATMVDYLNQTQALHIVTIEDPVEFVYADKRSTIDQRQLGSDTKSFCEALRRVLRQDPDVVVIGEMRDRETMELAMHAAETGHLVFSTLHTNDVRQTIDRIVDAFPPESAHQARSMLALTLQAVVSQRLVPQADGRGRVVAAEVMINSPSIRDLIAGGNTSQLEAAMAGSGGYYQMQTFNQALVKLAREGAITEDAALGVSTNPTNLKLLLNGIGHGSETKARPQETPSTSRKTSVLVAEDTPPLKIERMKVAGSF